MFFKNVLMTFGSRVIVIILGLVSGVIVARHLGPEGKGVFAVLGVIIGIATQFGNLGLHTSNTYFISKDPSKTNKVIGNSVWSAIIVGSFISLIIFIFYRFYPSLLGSINQIFLIITLISIPFLLLALFFQNIILGQKKIFFLNLTQILNQLFVVVGVFFIFYLFKRGLLSLIALSTAVGILSSLVYYFYLIRNNKFKIVFDWIFFKESFRFAFKSYIAGFIVYLILKSDIYLINFYKGTAETGLYSLVSGFADIIYILPASIGTILFPWISSAHDLEKTAITSKVSRHTALIMAFICAVIIFFGKFVIVTLYGVAFAGSFYPLLLLLPGIFFWSLSSIYMNHFAGKGMPSIVIWSPLAGLIVNVLINLLFIPKFGMYAAAISSSAAYGTLFFINLIYLSKTENQKLSDLIIIKKQEVINLLARFKILKERKA